MKFIAVDWGSSSFRAYLINDSNQVEDCISNSKGVFTQAKGEFANTLNEACDPWLKRWPNLPVVMAGMVGSRNGWIETPYVPCPVNPNDLGKHLSQVEMEPRLQIQVIPGVSGNSPSHSPDVMRGEETQIFGALRLCGHSNAMICLPGTHSKWAQIQNGAINQFSTFFTGEAFALLQQHSSIGSILDNNRLENSSENSTFDESAFIEGVQYSRQPGGLLHHIFSPRAKFLTQCGEQTPLRSFLSGIVIGNEFSGASELYTNTNTLLVVANNQLQTLYRLAGQVYGYHTQDIDADQAIVAGLITIAEDALSLPKETQC